MSAAMSHRTFERFLLGLAGTVMILAVAYAAVRYLGR
jgi:hypothetical protein